MHSRLSPGRPAFSSLEPLEPRLLLSATPAFLPLDPPPPVVTVDSLADSVAAETLAGQPANTATFHFARTGDTTGPLTVHFRRTGTALITSDYVLKLGAVTLPASTNSVVIPTGAASVDLTVSPVDDTLVEPTETVILSLLANTDYALGAAATQTATVSILDNEPVVTVAASDATAAETAAGEVANPGTFTVSRTGSTAGALTVRFTRTGTATITSDYVLKLGATTLPASTTSVVIPVGAASVDVTVSPVDDFIVEPTETVILSLSANAAYHLGAPAAQTATVSILDNEPTVTINATDATAAETLAGDPANPGTITISRTGSTANPLTVSFSRSGTATLTSDYVLKLGAVTLPASTTSVVIPVGAASVDLTVSPIDDTLVEPTETVILTLKTSTAYNLGATAAQAATVSILDNEPVVTIAATDATASETLAGQPTDTGTIVISRTGATTAPLTVSFARAGTATFTSDYVLMLGAATLSASVNSVVIPIGQTSVTLTVQPVDDLVAEPTETVILTVQASAAYHLADLPTGQIATVNILDNEPVVSIVAVDPNAAETLPGDPVNTGLFAIARSGSTAAPLTVSFRTSGLAALTQDYTLSVGGVSVTNSVTIPAGQGTVFVLLTPVDNRVFQPPHAAQLLLSGTANYNLSPIAANRSASVVIADNEPVVSIVAVDPTATRTPAGAVPDTGTYRVSRTGATTAALTVFFRTFGTGVSGVDYTLDAAGTPVATSVVFPVGQASVDINLQALEDSTPGATKTAGIALLGTTAYGLDLTAALRSATVNILEDKISVSIRATDATANATLPDATADNGTIRITRTGNTTAALTVYFDVGGTANLGATYLLLSGGVPLAVSSVTIAAGQSFVDVVVSPLLVFAAAQPAGTVTLNLLSDDGYQLDPLAANLRATVNINPPATTTTPVA